MRVTHLCALLCACGTSVVVSSAEDSEQSNGALSGDNGAAENLAAVNLSANNLAGANLSANNLAGANLSGNNLAGANLGGTNLAASNLAASNLGGTNLAGSNLGATNLAGANLAGANLAGANLAGANLAGSNLATSTLSGSSVAGLTPGHGASTTGTVRLPTSGVAFGLGGAGTNIHNLATVNGLLSSGEDLFSNRQAACVVLGVGSTAFSRLVMDNAAGPMFGALKKHAWGFADSAGVRVTDAWELVVWGASSYCVFVIAAPSDSTFQGVRGFVKAVFRWNAAAGATLTIGELGGTTPAEMYTGMMGAASKWAAGTIDARTLLAGQLAFASATTNNITVKVDFASWVRTTNGSILVLGNVGLGATGVLPAYVEGVFTASSRPDGLVDLTLSNASSTATGVQDYTARIKPAFTDFQRGLRADVPLPKRCIDAISLAKDFDGVTIPATKCDRFTAFGGDGCRTAATETSPSSCVNWGRTGGFRWSTMLGAGAVLPHNDFMTFPDTLVQTQYSLSGVSSGLPTWARPTVLATSPVLSETFIALNEDPVGSCTPESDLALCARVAPSSACGAITAVDTCGLTRRVQCGCTPSLPAGAVTEVEPNDTPATANAVAIGTTVYTHISSVGAGANGDWFKISVPPTQTASVGAKFTTRAFSTLTGIQFYTATSSGAIEPSSYGELGIAATTGTPSLRYIYNGDSIARNYYVHISGVEVAGSPDWVAVTVAPAATTAVCTAANADCVVPAGTDGAVSGCMNSTPKCLLRKCDSGYYVSGDLCVPNVCTPNMPTATACPVANGAGINVCNSAGSGYACSATSCNAGYAVGPDSYADTCIKAPVSLANGVPSTASSATGVVLLVATVPANAVSVRFSSSGTDTFEVRAGSIPSLNSYDCRTTSSCTLTTPRVQTNYYVVVGTKYATVSPLTITASWVLACTPGATQACAIANGLGSQTCANTQLWGTCAVTSCNAGYVNLGGTCAALALTQVSLSATSVKGGTAVTGTVTLNGPAPSGGAIVALTSSSTAVATVPASVTIPAGTTSVTFTVTTKARTTTASTTIKATWSTSSATAVLTATP